MPEIMLTSNARYLTLGGIVLHTADLVSFSSTWSQNSIATTAGNREHARYQGGLKENSFTITVGYRISMVEDLIFEEGAYYMLEYGPEGAVSGKPRHVQEVLLESTSGPSHTAEKEFVTFEFTLKGSDDPVHDFKKNAVYP